MSAKIELSHLVPVAYHRVSATARNKELLPGHQFGVEEDFVVCGRYINELARRDGNWKIERRTLIHDWERWDVPDDRGFPHRDRSAAAEADRSSRN